MQDKTYPLRTDLAITQTWHNDVKAIPLAQHVNGLSHTYNTARAGARFGEFDELAFRLHNNVSDEIKNAVRFYQRSSVQNHNHWV